MHGKCVSYFESLYESGRGFRLAYELAQELQSEPLKELCIEHLKAQDKAYKIAVQGCYRIDEEIPEEVLNLVL